MAQTKMTCARCGRTRYESRGRSVRAYGVRLWACLAKASCRKARQRREEHGR